MEHVSPDPGLPAPGLAATPRFWQPRRDVTFTDYHAKYFAHELARRCPSESKRPAESPRISSARNARFFAAQDQVDQQRGSLIANIEGKLFQSSRCTPVFTVRWKLA